MSSPRRLLMADTMHKEVRPAPLKEHPGGEVALLMTLLSVDTQATSGAEDTQAIDVRPRGDMEASRPQEVDDFYMRDRPPHPTLLEDRPRGGGGPLFAHQKIWVTIGVVFAIFIELVMGIALFP
jgi:hypothetical protein